MSIHTNIIERPALSAQQQRELDATWRARHGNAFPLVKNPFQDIPISSFLLLLTPFLHFMPPEASTAPGTDPFEPLGKTFAEFQDDVKHIPYIPKHGLTDIHQAHIPLAGGIIVVICESSLSGGLGSERLDDEVDQFKFAEQVSGIATPLGIPHILLIIGVRQRSISFTGLQVRVRNWNDQEDVADLLYEL